MQFITWDKFYEKNKDNITDKQAAYEEYIRLHRSFIESIFPNSKPKYISPENNNINIYNYYGNQGNPQ
jgi:hypothetical protein